jgi:DNA primase
VTLAMDADTAGAEAMSRGLAVVERAGADDPDAPVETTVDWSGMVRLHAVAPIEVDVFTVPQGKDPDEAIRADPAAFSTLAALAVPPFEFRLRHELAKTDHTNPRAMLDLADRLLPVVAAVSDRALQAHYLAQLAAATGAREDDLRARLRDGSVRVAHPAQMPLRERAQAAVPTSEPESQSPAAVPPSAGAPRPAGVRIVHADKHETLCLRLLYNFRNLRQDGMLLEEDLFTDAANRLLFQAWRGSPDAGAVPEKLPPEMAAHLTTVLQERMPPFDEPAAERALADVVRRMRLQRLEERKRLLAATLHEAETAADGETVASLALEDLRLGVELHQLEAALRQSH